MNRAYDRQILTLAVPALGALAADPLMSIVDTIFVGRLGLVPLAAMGIDAVVFNLAFFAFNFLALGVTSLVSAAIGRGDENQANRIISNGLKAALGLGLVAMLVLELAAGPFLRFMGATGDVYEEALGYLRIRALASPAVLIMMLGHGAFRGYQNTRTPFVVTLALNIVNLVLCPILIFAVGWGLNGAATATLIAQWTGAGWFLMLMWRRLGMRYRGSSSDEMRTLLRVGRDVVVRAAANLVVFTAAARAATALGVVEIAAHQVVMQVLILLALAVDALAVAAQTMVARFDAQGQSKESWDASIRLLQLGAMIGGCLFVVLLAGRSVFPGWFTTDPQVIDAIDGVWLILALLHPVAAPVYVWEGVVLGTSDFRYLAVMMVASMAGALLVILFAVSLGWGLVGIWCGFGAFNLLRGLMLGWWQFNPNSRLRHPSASPA